MGIVKGRRFIKRFYIIGIILLSTILISGGSASTKAYEIEPVFSKVPKDNSHIEVIDIENHEDNDKTIEDSKDNKTQNSDTALKEKDAENIDKSSPSTDNKDDHTQVEKPQDIDLQDGEKLGQDITEEGYKSTNILDGEDDSPSKDKANPMDEDESGKLPPNDEVEVEWNPPEAKIITASSNVDLKRVALTFDDGPDDDFTPKVLDVLKQYDVKATFFVLGSLANKNKEVLSRIDSEGHVIASHGWSHKDFKKLSKDKAISELKRTNDVIKEVTGKTNRFFRLPYGSFNKKVLKTVADEGFYNIYWSIDPRDWSGNSPDTILKNIQKNVKPGSIILMHSAGSQKSITKSVKSLPSIIEFLQREGYEMVTIPELLDFPS